MTTRPFRDLTRRERLYRYRDLAKIALQAYGIENAQLSFIQYLANVIYRGDLPCLSTEGDEKGPYVPNRYLLRLHAWDNVPYINSELIWLEALAGEGGLAVQKPILTLNGEFSVKVSSPGIPQGRCATLLGWLDGRKLGEKSIHPKHLNAVGRLVAQLHAFSSGWEPPEAFSRPTWDWDAQLGGRHFHVTLEELIETMPEQFLEPFKITSQKAKDTMASLGTGSDAFGLIHSDIYPENLLFKAGKAYPIDFEDCGYGYWIWDISVALCTWAWKPGRERMRDAFYEGYQAVRTLPAEQWELLELFIATQYATMLIWASAFLKDDPLRSDEHGTWRDESGERLLQYFDQ